MRFFKNLKIQWGWLLYKCKLAPKIIILAILMLSAYAAIGIFFLSFLSNDKGVKHISLSLQQQIFLVVYFLFVFCLYMMSFGARNPDNFKVAIDEAKKFAGENCLCVSNIAILIQETKETKDPAKLNKWIKNWRELSSQRAEVKGLEEEKEEMEKGIPLKEVKDEIEARKEKIKELESQLA